MTQHSVANLRRFKHLARQDYEQQLRSTPGSASLNDAGPPVWDRGAWEAFKAQYGRPPFGMQPDGSFIHPPTLAGAPDWVYAEMNLRKPPVTVMPQ